MSPAGGMTLDRALSGALAGLAPGAPVVILIHGYRYDPARPAADPHRLLFGPPVGAGVLTGPDPRCTSWPHQLGIGGTAGRENGPSGLAIGFGWPARVAHLPQLLSRGTTGFAEVYHRAGIAGRALAALLGRIAALRPGAPVDILAHSLGARVAISALPALDRGGAAALGRMILLGGAEFAGTAEAAFAAAPAARPEVYSITARHNDPYDLLFETFAPRSAAGADAVLSRRPPRLRNWITLQIDGDATRRWARARGIALAPGTRRMCHWGFYTLPGAMTLYGRILREREVYSVAALRGTPALLDQEPRWARFRPQPPMPGAGASMGQDAAAGRRFGRGIRLGRSS